MRERSGYPLAGFFLDSAAVTIRLRESELEEAEDAIVSWQRTAGRYLARPLQLALLGANAGPEAVVRELAVKPFRPLSTEAIDFSSLGSLAAWTDVASIAGSTEIAEALIDPLQAVLDAGIEFSLVPPALLSRCAATIATILGRYRQAEIFLERARTVAEHSGATVELALVELASAELFAARGDRPEAVVERASAAMSVLGPLDMVRAAGHARALIRRVGHEYPMVVTEVPEDELSGSELAVISGLANGWADVQSAAALFLSERTVARHRARIALRLGIRSRDDAIQFLGSRKQNIAEVPLRPPAIHDGLRATVPLSRREREVLERIALGRTNQQIADELFISLYTVVRHVANIFDKTGSANRTEAARFYSHD